MAAVMATGANAQNLPLFKLNKHSRKRILYGSFRKGKHPKPPEFAQTATEKAIRFSRVAFLTAINQVNSGTLARADKVDIYCERGGTKHGGELQLFPSYPNPTAALRRKSRKPAARSHCAPKSDGTLREASISPMATHIPPQFSEEAPPVASPAPCLLNAAPDDPFT